MRCWSGVNAGALLAQFDAQSWQQLALSCVLMTGPLITGAHWKTLSAHYNTLTNTMQLSMSAACLLVSVVFYTNRWSHSKIGEMEGKLGLNEIQLIMLKMLDHWSENGKHSISLLLICWNHCFMHYIQEAVKNKQCV